MPPRKMRSRLAGLALEWIDIANTEYRYAAIRIPVFLTCFLSQTELLNVEKNQVLTKY
jgi:hypothetical protein